jgi:hypothetical protein
MVHYLQRLMTLREIPLGSAKSQESRERFAIINDPIGAFVKAQCIIDQRATTRKQDLAEAGPCGSLLGFHCRTFSFKLVLFQDAL